jgi:hypothetical protein
MVVLIALGLIGADLYLLYVTAHAPDAVTNPRSGLRSVATILIILGGLIIIGTLVQAGILK